MNRPLFDFSELPVSCDATSILRCALYASLRPSSQAARSRFSRASASCLGIGVGVGFEDEVEVEVRVGVRVRVRVGVRIRVGAPARRAAARQG
jgi:hypothetical protein